MTKVEAVDRCWWRCQQCKFAQQLPRCMERNWCCLCRRSVGTSMRRVDGELAEALTAAARVGGNDAVQALSVELP